MPPMMGTTFSTIPGSSADIGSASASPDQSQELMKAIASLVSDPTKTITSQSVIPQAAMQPMPQKQYAQPVNGSAYREFQTKGGHQRAAQADLFANIGNLVQTAEKNSDAKKSRNLAVDLERVMSAASNPNDPQNQQILNDILSDPKKRKEIAEALNISFTGEEDTRKPHQVSAVQKALSIFRGKQQQQPNANPAGGTASGGTVPGAATSGTGQNNFSQQLLSQLPKVQGLSPQMQAVIELTKNHVLPSADKQLEANVSLFKQQMTDQTRLQAAQTLANAKDNETRTKYLEVLAQNQSKQEVAKVQALAVKYHADTQLQAIRDNAKWRDTTAQAVAKINTESKESTSADTTKLRGLVAQGANISKNIAALEKYLKDNGDKMSSKDAKGVMDFVKKLQSDQQVNQDQLNKALGVDTNDTNSGFDANDIIGDGGDYNSIQSWYNKIFPGQKSDDEDDDNEGRTPI